MVTAFLSEESAKPAGALEAIAMCTNSSELPSELLALIANTYAPTLVGVPLKVAVAALNVKPSGSPRVSKLLAQLGATPQAGIVVLSVLSSNVAAG
ncbi:unannotated protein [freshwater metagenome]|uniref:Unannotated protein n=1 Tax=freshwater metagenome TaxID=449393 RepID=A0A6J6N2J0_9ZZZZ